MCKLCQFFGRISGFWCARPTSPSDRQKINRARRSARLSSVALASLGFRQDRVPCLSKQRFLDLWPHFRGNLAHFAVLESQSLQVEPNLTGAVTYPLEEMVIPQSSPVSLLIRCCASLTLGTAYGFNASMLLSCCTFQYVPTVVSVEPGNAATRERSSPSGPFNRRHIHWNSGV